MTEFDVRYESVTSEILKCRLCLQKSDNMSHIFQRYYETSIAEKIKSCLNILLTERDINDLNCICETCVFNLDSCIDFRRKCEESERSFFENKINLEMMQPIKKKDHKTKIKLEKKHKKSDRKQNNNASKKNIKFTAEQTSQLHKRLEIGEENLKDNETINHDFGYNASDSLNSNRCSNDIILESSLKTDILITKSKAIKVIRKEVENKELLKCNTCKTQCQSKYVLKVHMRTHSGERPFQCDICEKRFVSKSNMNMHKRLTHSEEKQVCSECGKSFSCLTYLKRHMIIHYDVKPHGCTLCEKRFTTKSYLKEHIARHKGDKKFFCEVCGLKFISDVNLKQHLMVHGIETGRFKRHQCPHCPYRTQGRVDLERHIRTHTGEKPFVCEFGGCEAAFAGKGTLKEHLRTHSGERPYGCSECPARFRRSDKYKNHLLKKHNIMRGSQRKRSKLAIEEQVENSDAVTIPMDIVKHDITIALK